MSTFGPRHVVSKGAPGLGLKMIGGASRSSIAGGARKTGDLSRRMAAGKVAGRPKPHGAFSQTQLGRIKTDPLA